MQQREKTLAENTSLFAMSWLEKQVSNLLFLKNGNDTALTIIQYPRRGHIKDISVNENKLQKMIYTLSATLTPFAGQ